MQGFGCHFISVSGKNPKQLKVTSRHDHRCLLGRKASNQTNIISDLERRGIVIYMYLFGKNKGADQICGFGTTDLRLCFSHTQKHTVYPVTPNAGMFYQRGYKHLRRGNTQGKKTCNSRISIVPISNITFQTLCKRAFLRNNGASKQ